MAEKVSAVAVDLVIQHADTMAPNITGLVLNASGRVASKTAANTDGVERPPVSYHSDKTGYYVPLSDWTASAHNDLVEYEHDNDSGRPRERRRGAFKHYLDGFWGWQEANMHARMPCNANILPVDRLVLEEYLRQLMRAIDDLNFTHGIAHHNVAPRNLLVDAATDDVLLYDFSVAGNMGAQTRGFGRQRFTGELAKRNDAKGLVLTLHEIIKRDPSYQPPRPLQLQLLDEADLVGSPDKWMQNPDVCLDPARSARDYYDELMAWLAARRARTGAEKRPSHPIEWPEKPGAVAKQHVLLRPRACQKVRAARCEVEAPGHGSPGPLADVAGHGLSQNAVHMKRPGRKMQIHSFNTGRYADQAVEGLEEDKEAVAGVDWGGRLSASSRRSPDLDTAAIGPKRKKTPDTDTKLLEDEAPNSPGLTAKRTRRKSC
ncbi:hypothetical protein B0T24DRAFT_666477 [Lasiosphaeria ovina]|uniref:Protein kinase domain-containing protein n=1 Tax=Lasiosphaeria ovina TaxID=92902 RepID=A0AAE0KAD9_9PEZI|nr:hypothetical protein B0T24DRAFT_666477 [Lasiosphaeria ovina]